MVTVNETLVREMLDRLISVETLLKTHMEETARRFDETNRRIDETNQRITETNQRITETNEATNRRIDRMEDRMEDRYERLNSRMDRLFYTMIGLGVAVIASLVAGQILD